MLKPILLFIILFIVFACDKAKYKIENPIPANLKRFVVYQLEHDSTRQDNNDFAKQAITKAKGKIHKKLRYHNGYVAFIDPENIPFSELSHGIIIEEDIVHSIDLKGCAEEPQPDFPPPPDTQPSQEYTWAQLRIKNEKAHGFAKGENIVVCVVDTGIDKEHVDLKDNIQGGESFVDIESDYNDINGHGTHVSGTIAALENGIGVIGVAPKAKIIANKALDFQGNGYSSDIADAVRSCANQNAHIISMSLGSTRPSNLIHDAIKYAKNKGLYIIAAAGNDSGSVNYPAAFQETVAVSASNEFDQLAYFSSYGEEIDFIAGGVRIKSTVPNNNYAEYSGTSMSTPMVAGVYALMLSKGRNKIAVEDIGLPYNKQGLGLVDALETVK